MDTIPLLRWEKYLEKAFSKIHNLDDLLTKSIKTTKALNFEFFAYEIFKSTPFMRPEFYIYSNYPAKWTAQYRKMNHALTDPRIHHSKVLDEILCWNNDLFKETPSLMFDSMERPKAYTT
jgi:LuxR family transcriptional regulator